MQEDVLGCKESVIEEEKWPLEGRRGWEDRMCGGSWRFSQGRSHMCWVCEDVWELDGVGVAIDGVGWAKLRARLKRPVV